MGYKARKYYKVTLLPLLQEAMDPKLETVLILNKNIISYHFCTFKTLSLI